MTTESEKLLYHYRAWPIRAIDGDTIEVKIDLGFRLHRTERVRVLGCNCPERTDAGWEAAKLFTEEWLYIYGGDQTGKPGLMLHTSKGDSFGRWLAVVEAVGHSLGDDLIQAGHAVPMKG